MAFTDKVVLVTGAASGIGANTAIKFSELGASVVLVDCNANNLKDVVATIRAAGGSEPLEIVADVTKETERIIKETINKFGKLNVLVNCAGIGRTNGEVFGSLETFDTVLEVNLRSVLALTKLAVPHLEATRGNIVNVSSILGCMAHDEYTAYALSKAGIDHFTRCAAVELAPKGLRVNAVKPGLIRTPIWHIGKSATEAEEMDQVLDQRCKAQPVTRVGVAGDVTNAILFLADDAASFITGNLMYVDGGRHLVKF